MTELGNEASKEVLIDLISKMNRVVRWDLLADTNYRTHVRVAKNYLRGSAVVLMVGLICALGFTLDWSKALWAPTVIPPVSLILFRVDRRIKFHLRAAAEYLISMREFTRVTTQVELFEAIAAFESRSQEYDPLRGDRTSLQRFWCRPGLWRRRPSTITHTATEPN